MMKKYRCKKCGFEADFDEMWRLALLEVAGAEVPKKYKYCNWLDAESEEELEEHEFELVEE